MLVGGGTYADGSTATVSSPTSTASNSALLDELAALRAEVQGMREEARATGAATVANTGKTARLNQKWDDVGLPITTETDLTAVYGA